MRIELPEVDLKLEGESCCPRCYYAGKIEIVVGKTPTKRDKKKEVDCPNCNGVGYIVGPTVFGQEILDFIKKYRETE